MAPRISLIMLILAGVSTNAGAQVYKLRQPGGQQADQFGASVVVDRQYIVVGASGADDCGINSGAAFVFSADPATNRWTFDTSLQPRDCGPEAFFGRKLDLDGNRVIVTASPHAVQDVGNSAAYIFRRDPRSKEWSQEAKLLDPDRSPGRFAADVALADSLAVVARSGDIREGSYSGGVYVYRLMPAGEWSLIEKLQGSDGVAHGVFGGAVALSDSALAVSAPSYLTDRPGSVHVYEMNEAGSWQATARLGGINDFEIPIDIDGKRLIVGDSQQRKSGSGSAIVYVKEDGGWVIEQSLEPSSPYELGSFGAAVAISNDRALVVGYDEQLQFDFNIDRVVYVFGLERESGQWRQQHVIDVGSVFFGSSVAVDNRIAVIGEAGEESAGSAFVVHIH